MAAVCFYFQIHQPYRLRRYTVFDLGQSSFYEDDDRNCDTMLQAARTCYLPMNALLLRLINKHGTNFRVAFSISGTALEQFEQYAPEVLTTFKALADTGCVEFLGETYSHSFTFLYAPEEYTRQVRLHSQKIRQLFGKKPTVYRHTELIYNNDLAKAVEDMGFKAMLAEGNDHILGWRSAGYVYQRAQDEEHQKRHKLKILLRNRTLSTDISRRFSKKEWDKWPLNAETFAQWCKVSSAKEHCLNLFMPYAAFGLRHASSTGIFDFMEALPDAFLRQGFTFKTPSEVAKAPAVGNIDVPYFMSWASSGNDLDKWLGNDMQKDAIHSLYALHQLHPELYKNEDICRTWQHLQSSEHFAYMCTKWYSSEQDYPLETPYSSPYDAYINYMNVLADFELRLHECVKPTIKRRLVKKEKKSNEALAKDVKTASSTATKVITKAKKILRPVK